MWLRERSDVAAVTSRDVGVCQRRETECSGRGRPEVRNIRVAAQRTRLILQQFAQQPASCLASLALGLLSFWCRPDRAGVLQARVAS